MKMAPYIPFESRADFMVGDGHCSGTAGFSMFDDRFRLSWIGSTEA